MKLLFILLFSPSILFAQNNEIESYNTVLNPERNNTSLKREKIFLEHCKKNMIIRKTGCNHLFEAEKNFTLTEKDNLILIKCKKDSHYLDNKNDVRTFNKPTFINRKEKRRKNHNTIIGLSHQEVLFQGIFVETGREHIHLGASVASLFIDHFFQSEVYMRLGGGSYDKIQMGIQLSLSYFVIKEINTFGYGAYLYLGSNFKKLHISIFAGFNTVYIPFFNSHKDWIPLPWYGVHIGKVF